MIERQLGAKIDTWARQYPIVTITGPRQSGKTTLARALFPAHRYISLEELDNRRFAAEDPRGFLKEFERGAIIDEVERCPKYRRKEAARRPCIESLGGLAGLFFQGSLWG